MLKQFWLLGVNDYVALQLFVPQDFVVSEVKVMQTCLQDVVCRVVDFVLEKSVRQADVPGLIATPRQETLPPLLPALPTGRKIERCVVLSV